MAEKNGVTLYQDETGVLRSMPTALIDAVRTAAASAMATAPIGYEQLTSEMLTAAMQLNPPTGAVRAIAQANGGSGVRWRQDGQNPTANTGMRIDAGTEREFVGDLSALRFISEGGNSVLDVTYYG